MIIIGVLIVLAGALPFLSSVNALPESFPTTGAAYSLVIIAVGVFGFVYAILNVTMMGPSKMITIAIAAMTILGGLVPFIASFLPQIIPTVFPAYNLMIILIGGLGIVYGFISMG
ncbi:MAG: hypothetical protein ABIJ08_07110 [Nanoarchaeota archaeon]